MADFISVLNHKYKFKLVSRSPRRRKILQELGLKFKVINNPKQPPEKIRNFFYIQDIKLATKQKLLGLKPGLNEVLIACDTIVVYNFCAFGKPKSRAQAVSFLRKFSGKKHYVLSCLAIMANKNNVLHYYQVLEKTAVYFRKITDAEISAYVKTREPYDKAGAYAVQGKAKIFVRKICGCYDNVVGLPIAKFLQLLKRL